MLKIFPSLLSADPLNLGATIQKLEPYCDGFHLDIMDFHYVPNLMGGPACINAIRTATTKQLWVHLMITKPANMLSLLQLNPHDIITVHYEGTPLYELQKLMEAITSAGQIPSVALRPATPISILKALLQTTTPPQQILLMAVEPGFSGQEFLPETLKRLRELITLRAASPQHFTIALDGGITQKLIETLIKEGAEEVAVTSAIFSAPDPVVALKKLTAQ